VAAALAAVALATGVSGTDAAAAAYRIALFDKVGFTLWDPGWYGGHWTLDYSAIFAPIGALFGIAGLDIICTALSALAFDLLLVPRFGRAGRAGSLLFAVGTVVQVAVGRVPFLLASAFALLALVAVLREERVARVAGVTLALAATLASPLAGLFLALAMLAWLLAGLPRLNWWAVAVVIAALAPIAVFALVFRGQGPMPFAPLDLAGELVAVLALSLAVRERVLRIGLALYALLVVGAYVVPSALGVNATRLGTSAGLGLAIALWRSSLRARLLVLAAAVPLALGQWTPAGSALLGAYDPATSAAYFAPLIDYLVAHDEPLGRVEVVPLRTHWESDYVALRLPLARGWERQIDTAQNPIFYRPGALSVRSYTAWLDYNAVRFVALADAPIDYAGVGEARLVRAGVPALREVWHDSHWRVYAVSGAPAIVSGPGAVLAEPGARLVIAVRAAGRLTIRVRGGTDWRVTRGAARVSVDRAGWLALDASEPGRVVLEISP
jgi:hypothetical protein